MRLIPFLILALFLCGSVGAAAAEDPQRAQVSAATRDAVESLRQEILTAPMLADLTVGEFVEKAGASDSLQAALRKTEQIGGTRWIDDQTCIVRMQFSGDKLADTLIAIARDHPDRTPVPAGALERRLAGLRRRMFSAEGTSTAAKFFDLRPPGPWRDVPPAERRQALDAARDDAASRVLDSLRDVDLGGGKTVADALEVPSVKDALTRWLAERPVVGVEFGEDMQVRITLSAPPEELWGVFRKALEAQNEVPTPKDEAGWQRLHDQVRRRIARAIGRAELAGPPAGRAAPRIKVPAAPPAWVRDQVDARGSGASPGGPLHSQRRAIADAQGRLRKQIDALPFDRDLTLGEAAKKDDTIDAAIDRSLDHAHPYKVHYRPGGGADVSLSLDLRDLWHELLSRE